MTRSAGESQPPWIVIAGPTGSGKSALGVAVAEQVGGEIVNADSVQVYRGFDIGSAKPPRSLRERVPHHLFDHVTADEDFHAAEFSRRARQVCEEIESRGKRPVLVGGTGFYLRSLLRGLPEMPEADEGIRERLRRIHASARGRALLHRWLGRVDPVAAAKIAVNDRHRVERALEVWMLTGKPISEKRMDPGADAQRAVLIALAVPREILVKRLDRRVSEMYAAGLVEETRHLLERYPPTARPFGAIGYAEAARVVWGDLTAEAAEEETKRRTRAYAKRQMTWFRGEQDVHWLNAERPLEELLEESLRIIGADE
jgi:tRNA dimethylallyltransferase